MRYDHKVVQLLWQEGRAAGVVAMREGQRLELGAGAVVLAAATRWASAS